MDEKILPGFKVILNLLHQLCYNNPLSISSNTENFMSLDLVLCIVREDYSF